VVNIVVTFVISPLHEVNSIDGPPPDLLIRVFDVCFSLPLGFDLLGR
jgi:hypothetical protein